MSKLDELEARVRAADPMASVEPDLREIRERVFAQAPAMASARPRHRPLLPSLLLVAAAAVVVVGGWAGAQVLTTGRAQQQLVTVTALDGAGATDGSTDAQMYAGTHWYTASGNQSVPLTPTPDLHGSARTSPFVQALPWCLGLTILALFVVRFAADEQRRSRRAVGALGMLAVGAVVVAQFALPGAQSIRRLSVPMGVTLAGNALVDLGPRPGDANGVELTLTCHSVGTFALANSMTIGCTQGRLGASRYWVRRLADAQHEIRVFARPGDSWRLEAAWAEVPADTWGLNQQGRTFGTANAQGTPDLVAATADNGRAGYLYSRMLANVSQRSSVVPRLNPMLLVFSDRGGLPVYAADGEHVVGYISVNPSDVVLTRSAAPSAPSNVYPY